MYNYAVTSVSKIISNEYVKEQFTGLVALQWKEVDHRRKTSDLDIDFSKYIRMEEAGAHYVVVAYEDDKLLGYLSMFITESPHTGELTATTDTIFIKKKLRGEGLGGSLIVLAEDEAVKRGAKHIMLTFKNDSPHPELVKDNGYFSYETIYAKSLGG